MLNDMTRCTGQRKLQCCSKRETCVRYLQWRYDNLCGILFSTMSPPDQECLYFIGKELSDDWLDIGSRRNAGNRG